MPNATDPAAAFHVHDHAHCSHDVLAEADRIARDRRLRLTPVRRRALEILLESHRAMGAYDVLERLAEDGYGNQPPVAYRALEFLVEHGLAHRIRRLNAFTACMQPGAAHAPAFFICDSCDAIAEVSEAAVRHLLNETAAAIGFTVTRVNVEALGTCPACAQGAEPC